MKQLNEQQLRGLESWLVILLTVQIRELCSSSCIDVTARLSAILQSDLASYQPDTAIFKQEEVEDADVTSESGISNCSLDCHCLVDWISGFQAAVRAIRQLSPNTRQVQPVELV